MASLFDRPAGSRATLVGPDSNVRRILEKWQSGQRLSDSERRRLGQRMSSERTAIGTGSLDESASAFDFSGETPQPNASFDPQPQAQPEQSYVTGGQSPFAVPASGGFNRQIYDESQPFVTTESSVFGQLGETASMVDTELTEMEGVGAEDQPSPMAPMMSGINQGVTDMQAGIFDQPNNLTGGSNGRV